MSRQPFYALKLFKFRRTAKITFTIACFSSITLINGQFYNFMYLAWNMKKWLFVWILFGTPWKLSKNSREINVQPSFLFVIIKCTAKLMHADLTQTRLLTSMLPVIIYPRLDPWKIFVSYGYEFCFRRRSVLYTNLIRNKFLHF